MGALPAGTSDQLRLLLKRSLDKDRRTRIADVFTVRFLLTETLPANGASPNGVATSRPWRAAVILVAAILITALATSAAWWFRPSQASPAVVSRFSFELPDGQRFMNLARLSLALSPDGSEIVYAANRGLYSRSLSALDAKPIPGTESSLGASAIAFSPDGRWIAYWSNDDRAIKRIPRAGGSPLMVCQADGLLDLSWDGGRLLFSSGSGSGPTEVHGVMSVAASGGEPEILARVGLDERAFALCEKGRKGRGPQIEAIARRITGLTSPSTTPNAIYPPSAWR